MVHIPHGAIIAAEAERQRKRMEEEEEKMTGYKNDELNDNWEFKIVRSDSNAFRKPEHLQNLIDEEAISGWDMLEKLDDRRVRFKRPKSARDKDFGLPQGIDPYRSRYGGQSAAEKIGIGLAIGLLIMVILMAAYFLISDGGSLADITRNWSSISISIIGFVVAVLGAIAITIRKR